MINRRQILQAGIAATSLPLVTGLARAPERSVAAHVLDHGSLYKVLFDRRFAAARSFGREAVRWGAPVQGFDGDITDVWYHDLALRWRQGPAPIGGLTAYGALFCLERLAWDARMRVISRTEHRYTRHESLFSWVIALPVRAPVTVRT
jgi:hypothetical protein